VKITDFGISRKPIRGFPLGLVIYKLTSYLTVSKLLQIIGQICTFNRGVALFTALHCMQRGLSYEHLSVRLSDRLSNAWIVTKRKHLAKKYTIMTNRKSPTSFPMSLRWTAYVAPNPPKGASRDDNFFRFPYEKIELARRKSAAKFLCVKTVSGKVVRLAYLSVHKWLVADVPFYLKFSTNVTHPILKLIFKLFSLVPSPS